MKIPDSIRSLIPGRSPAKPPAAGSRDLSPPEEMPGKPPVPASPESEAPRTPPAESTGDPGSRAEKEIAEQVRIAGLWKNHWRQYVAEEFRFRLRYGKSCRCDVCGEYRKELFSWQDRTFCATHLPAEWQFREGAGKDERPGEPGSSGQK